ncbi:MAG: hypothetical protein M1833_000816 [Piccolia ochrophora]|nr:MAG: hypothetical protein M1833_000816 [Piccolia ochrophora]
MKRKQNSSLPPLKMPADMIRREESSPAELRSSSDSFEFEPASPVMERREPLSPRTEAKLRDVCAEIVNDYMDPSDIYAQPAADPRVARPAERGRWITRLQSRYTLKNSRRPSQSRGRESRGRDRRRNEESSSNAEGGTIFKYVPRNAANSFSVTASSRSASLNRGRSSSIGQHECNSAVDRPQTANAAFDTTASTVCSTVFHSENNTRTKSTGVTSMSSANETPAEFKDPEAQYRADARARAWMADEFARRRAEQERPPSRGSRIMNYIRPRSSNDSLRSTHTDDSTWWRSESLRRRDSNSSITPYNESIESPGPDIDLNRPLPPLPSISNWNTKKPSTAPCPVASIHSETESVHVSRLMKAATASQSPTLMVKARVDELPHHKGINQADSPTSNPLRMESTVSPVRSVKQLPMPPVPKTPSHKSVSGERPKSSHRQESKAKLDHTKLQRPTETACRPQEGRRMGRLRRQLSQWTLNRLRGSRQTGDESRNVVPGHGKMVLST